MAASNISVAEDAAVEIYDKLLAQSSNTALSPTENLMVQVFKRLESDTGIIGPKFLHEQKWGSSLHNQYTRKLVNECHGIFLSANRLCADIDEANRSQSIKKLSQKYHSVLLACMEDLGDAAVTEALTEIEILNQKTMFSEIELIWSLIEVLLFDMQSRTLVLYRLLDWIQWHFPEPEKKAQEILASDEPYEHHNYWDTILQLVLQGNTSAARSLLKLHKCRNREDFLSMDELLRKMPMYSAETLMSWNEFQMRWHHWQEESRRRLSEGEFSGVEGLEILCQVLCGNKDVLTEKSYLCNNWYHLLISVLLYTDPCVSTNVLGHLARSYSSNISTESQLSELDKIILAAMELDIINLLKSCCSFHDGWWFVAHMTDLLYRGNYITSSTISHPSYLREAFLLSYAASLMTHGSLWQVGLDYLDQCQEFGREHLELWLQRVPLDSEVKAQKILFLAKQRNLDNLVKSVCQVMTARAIKNEMFGTALSWVVQSKDVRFATDLANRWIKEYSETGKFQCFEILKNLGFSMLVSDKLTFLGKYCEFHKLYQEKDFRSAATLLVSLLSSGLVPKQFQIVLLLDALPLLEASEPVFTMNDTTQLIACLESMCSSSMKEEHKTGLLKKERLIRLALARNLARAFIYENSAS